MLHGINISIQNGRITFANQDFGEFEFRTYAKIPFGLDGDANIVHRVRSSRTGYCFLIQHGSEWGKLYNPSSSQGFHSLRVGYIYRLNITRGFGDNLYEGRYFQVAKALGAAPGAVLKEFRRLK